MSFDLNDMADIPPQFFEHMRDPAKVDLIKDIDDCFTQFPTVFKTIGLLCGVHQASAPDDLQLNEGKRQVFLQLCAFRQLANLTDEQLNLKLQELGHVSDVSEETPMEQ